MNSRALVTISCWFAVALISSVYIWVALGGGYLGDVLFGLFIPIGLLILVALAVTFGLASGYASSQEDVKADSKYPNELREINSKIDALIKEVEAIKKTIEE